VVPSRLECGRRQQFKLAFLTPFHQAALDDSREFASAKLAVDALDPSDADTQVQCG
jgi:hypothetical protein